VLQPSRLAALQDPRLAYAEAHVGCRGDGRFRPGVKHSETMLGLSELAPSAEKAIGRERWRACPFVVDSLIVWLLFIGALIACTYAAYEEISIGVKDEDDVRMESKTR
jgi:hypothetical protein